MKDSKLASILDGLFQRLSVLFGFLLLGSALVVAADVGSRRLFSITIPGAGELAGFTLGLASAWAIAGCAYARSHIAIDVVYGLLGPIPRRVLDIVGSLLTAGVLGVIAFYGAKMALQSAAVGSRSISQLPLPLAPIQALWAAGFVMGAAAALLAAIAAARRPPEPNPPAPEVAG